MTEGQIALQFIILMFTWLYIYSQNEPLILLTAFYNRLMYKFRFRLIFILFAQCIFPEGKQLLCVYQIKILKPIISLCNKEYKCRVVCSLWSNLWSFILLHRSSSMYIYIFMSRNLNGKQECKVFIRKFTFVQNGIT